MIAYGPSPSIPLLDMQSREVWCLSFYSSIGIQCNAPAGRDKNVILTDLNASPADDFSSALIASLSSPVLKVLPMEDFKSVWVSTTSSDVNQFVRELLP